MNQELPCFAVVWEGQWMTHLLLKKGLFIMPLTQNIKKKITFLNFTIFCWMIWFPYIHKHCHREIFLYCTSKIQTSTVNLYWWLSIWQFLTKYHWLLHKIVNRSWCLHYNLVNLCHRYYNSPDNEKRFHRAEWKRDLTKKGPF